ncbi:hypothetical protein DYI25_18525 [Mesobacillus boroniphilus]|uniref:Uncharacterized protein n=1 Tax=Mesobacillus boroniphilus TaxID=308892 RepID=A0A944GY01_9BACI|nr:hypothetical protein [Mesobacillus boroniphilus]
MSHQYKTIIPSETNIKRNNKLKEKAAEKQSSIITEVKPIAKQVQEDNLFLVKYFYPPVFNS